MFNLLKNQNWILPTCDSFPLIMSQFLTGVRSQCEVPTDPWVQKRWCHKKMFLHISVLDIMYRSSMMKNIYSPNLVGISSQGPRDMAAWIPNQSHWIGLVPNIYEPGQFIVILMRLIRNSCSHISCPHEPIHVKYGLEGFFIMFYWNMGHENDECKKENLMTSQYSFSSVANRSVGIEMWCVNL